MKKIDTEQIPTNINPPQRHSKEGNSFLHSVTKRYLFWFESEGKDGWTFEIEAEDSNDAYDKAYDTHGPQVAGMMYQAI